MARPTRDPEPTTNWQIVTGILAVVFVALAILAVLAVLGGGSDEESPGPGASASVSASRTPTASQEPTSEPSSVASAQPSGAAPAQPSPAASVGPSLAPSPSVSLAPSPGASPSPGSTACSGSAANREFFLAAADALSFEVYCALLPRGWTLTTGSYRRSGGGRLEIAYRGPGGATLRLRQGPAACTDAPACPPTGGDLGPATFGVRPGELLATDAGFAVDASEGPLLYIAETTRLDRAATTALAAALIPIR